MGLLAVVEDRPTPRAVYNWRVYVCAATVAFASMMIGYDSAFIGTTLALPSFTKEFDFAALSKAELSLVEANIVSIYQAGAFFGAIFAYGVAHFLGRLRGMVLFSLVFILGAGLSLGATGARGLGLIYASRVLVGLGVGGASMLAPIYMSEISPPAIRGRLVGLYELGWQIGGLVGFWINYGIEEHMPDNPNSWLIPFAVQLIPGGLLLIGSLLIRESPRWLFFKGKRAQALSNLCWLRQLEPTDVYLVEEVAGIDAAIEHQRTTVGLGFWCVFRAARNDRKILWRLFLGGMLFLWQNGSGINSVNYYSPTVFKSLGLTGTSSSFLTTGIFGVVKTSLTFVWLLVLIDQLGRRKLLMIGATGGSVCMWYLGAYLKVQPVAKTPGALTPVGKSAIFFFYLWTAFYTPSWNGTPWIVNSEFFQANVRQLGQANASACNWLFNFVISRVTPQMFDTMAYGVYFFFASLMVLSVPFVYFLLPETKSVPLESMDRLFQVKPVRKAHKTVMEELRAEEEEFRHDREGIKIKEQALNVEEAAVV